MGWGFFIFLQISFKILIGLCFIWYVCSCVGPLRQFKLVLRHFFHVHALFIVGSYCCILNVWQNVLVIFLCWIGLNWVPMIGFTLDWSFLPCFGQCVCILHTLSILCLNAMSWTHQAHTRPLLTHLIHLMMHTHAPTHALPRHTQT